MEKKKETPKKIKKVVKAPVKKSISEKMIL